MACKSKKCIISGEKGGGGQGGGYAFLLVEAIAFVDSVVFKDMCRSSILKWQYFRDLIILFLEYNHNERTFNPREL